MGTTTTAHSPGLSEQVESGLEAFVSAAKEAFGANLRSIVLYGSGAEGKLRATSDVNVLLVLAEFGREPADAMLEPIRLARATIHLRAMFLLESEVANAVQAFAQKFADMRSRHRVLYGDDPFEGMAATRQNEILDLRQKLLNLVLRLRASYVLAGLREEQLALEAAEAAGPLRSCAAALLELEGRPAASPKAALEQVAAASGANGELMGLISQARELRILPPGTAAKAMFGLIDLARAMHTRAQGLN